MRLLRRLVLRVGQELARNPDARAKAAQDLARTQRAMNDDIKPRAQQAWRDAQPEIQHAKRRLQRVAQELRKQYRKGRDGE
jgi:ferric-dicitrate binding protein FerR (iron transport regulator)